MNTVDAAARLGQPAGSTRPSPNLRQGWLVVTMLLVASFFLEAVFAGAMLSGAGWARAAHSATAMMLIASTGTAGLVSALTLRRFRHGPRLGVVLLSLAAVALVQAVMGALSAKGTNLVWLHVPFGVALVALAGQAVASARRLGED
jgi:hypothetical protein